MKNTRKKIYSLVILFASGLLQAQETFPDDTQDVPVNDYLPLLFMAGIGLAYWLFQKQKLAK
ncbi:hypothetical protein RF683_07655 [Flavobacterium sp. 20NA77.7]|uniref:PEP-CTERM protein-sorting domain-containing protein n=1 Tax=Flavobacterium nakdongensis TaxID=3073563 RepID=A0ABY9R7X1_9FLAO|nr:hypothetical protein [Flavobacterium sp. 20NA77.7]WMW77363.1 hypothetical protein RF683_07655 [Flavobacterium sp. 20NA77.7]